VFPDTPAEWRNDAEAERWAKVERVLAVVTAALEAERKEKRIGGALDASPIVATLDPEIADAFEGLDAAEVFRTSEAAFGLFPGDINDVIADHLGAQASGSETLADLMFSLPGTEQVYVSVRQAGGLKCARSWKVLPEVQRNLEQHGLQLTDRDLDAVRWRDAQHAPEQAA
jgi:isoleucyl-tRNA synthetase